MKKNFLFIQCDSMDGRVWGAAGHSAMRRATPNLDALAARGAMVTDGYCNSPLCCPSRASMWSGKQIFNCGAWNNFEGLTEETPTFASVLRDNGYHVGIIGKTDYLAGNHTSRSRVSAWTGEVNFKLRRPQFNENDKPEIIPAQVERVHELHWDYIGKSIEWLRTAAKGEKPFMLYTGINTPHPRFITSQRYVDMIDLDRIAIPPKDMECHPVIEYQRLCKNWAFGFSEETVRLVRTIYYAMIAEADAMSGKLINELDRLGLRDNTVIIFLSDHGEMAMEHDLYYKSNMYEASVRVPMIFMGPGIKQGLKITAPASLVDVFPTLMRLAEVPIPEGLDGNSLANELSGGKGNRPGYVFCEYHGENTNTGMYMLREGGYKYVEYGGGFKPQLFRLSDDPGEMINLAGTGLAAENELKKRLYEVVDVKTVSALVSRYNKESFLKWREAEKQKGTYEQEMSYIFSGYDNLTESDIIPWSSEDEKIIKEWLGEQ